MQSARRWNGSQLTSHSEHRAGKQLMRLAIRTNRRRPVPSIAEAEVHPERAAAEAMPSNAIVGDPERAVAALRRLAADTGADELMIAASTHGVAEKLRSLELLAAAWGLTPAGSAAG
jgi:alkanesulfonate monooxygenase SsuD/methylene tetrahydromethanopterin reductase-like flavin-dependent oxidoreductase (luciferase family)